MGKVRKAVASGALKTAGALKTGATVVASSISSVFGALTNLAATVANSGKTATRTPQGNPYPEYLRHQSGISHLHRNLYEAQGPRLQRGIARKPAITPHVLCVDPC